MNVPSQPCDNIQQQQDSGLTVWDRLNQYTDGLFPNSSVKTQIYCTEQHASQVCDLQVNPEKESEQGLQLNGREYK